MTTAKPLARYGAMGARVASGFAPSRQLHHLLGHDRPAWWAASRSRFDGGPLM